MYDRGFYVLVSTAFKTINLMFIKYKIFLSLKIVKSMLQFTIFVLIKN